MKKYEQFTKEQLQKMCDESTSFRELTGKIGYAIDSGSGVATVRAAVIELGLNTDHFTGQSHQKSLGIIRTPIEKYLSNEVKVKTLFLKNRLIQEGILKYQCNKCGGVEWLNQPIPLELHHKDGNNKNNNLNNLELLCPNCHAFTDTYRGKNKR